MRERERERAQNLLSPPAPPDTPILERMRLLAELAVSPLLRRGNRQQTFYKFVEREEEGLIWKIIGLVALSRRC
jgi:hypothetical protein